MADDLSGCLGVVFTAAAAVIVLAVALAAAAVTIAVGSVFGGGMALNNYAQSFMRNVRPEGDPDGWIAKGIVITAGVCLIALLAMIIIRLAN